MMAALEDAEIDPGEINYLNAHATSTPIGDISELRAIEKVFGKNDKVFISATKSMTGHLLGAAGAAEAIACVVAINENVIPPTINTKKVEPEFASNLNIVTGQSFATTVNYAMSNTFGFGGHIATLILKKFVA
jgi:3-oxoacyl-[acyl-carrier-protein] synthase II